MNVLPPNSMPANPLQAPNESFGQRHAIGVRIAAWCTSLVLGLGVFGRIMTFPLHHDEQIHVVAARMIFQIPLYRELGYNHLPGLPLLLGIFYTAMGSDHLLQTGRVLIFLCWIATAIVMAMIAYRQTGDKAATAVAILLLFAGTLLGPAGMLVTNNFLPIPFALLGVHLFMTALEGEGNMPRRLFAAGAAIGFAIALKISYVFMLPPVVLAAVMVPRQPGYARPGFAGAIRSVLLPLLAGGLVGGLPVLVAVLSGPTVLYEHTVRYFVGGHLAYWQHSTEPKAMSLAAKMLVAEDVWLTGGALLAGLLIGVTGLFLARNDPERLHDWPIALLAGLMLCGALGAFAPTPAYPQYYEPPVPFAVLLFTTLYARLSAKLRHRVLPLLATTAVLGLAIILPRVLSGLPDTVRPSHWTGIRIHAQGQQMRLAMAGTGRNGRVATLSPIVALEGGLPVYREFGAGPFVYRVAEYMSRADRRWFRTTSPRELDAFLDRDPPSAVIVGREPLLDGAFAGYAHAHGYVPTRMGDAQTQVFLRPPAVRH